MKDYIDIGSTPYEEDCVQLAWPDCDDMMTKEVNAYKHMLERYINENPLLGNRGETMLSVKSNQHDFGVYKEVVIYYNDNNRNEVEFAINLENNPPVYWDDEAKNELGKEYFDYIAKYANS